MRGHFPDDHRLSASTVPGRADECRPRHLRRSILHAESRRVSLQPRRSKPSACIPCRKTWDATGLSISASSATRRSSSKLWPTSCLRRSATPGSTNLLPPVKTGKRRTSTDYELGLKHSAATDHLHPAVMAKEVHDFLYKGDIDPKQTVTGCGGWTTGLFAGRWLRANRPGQGVVCGYQYGAIGPDLAMMIGASAAVQRGVGPQAPYKGAPALVVTSDAGIAYSMFELDTAAKYKIPIIAVIYNNNCWGMWPERRRLGAFHAHVSVPGKPPLRQNGRRPRRARRIRPDAGTACAMH